MLSDQLELQPFRLENDLKSWSSKKSLSFQTVVISEMQDHLVQGIFHDHLISHLEVSISLCSRSIFQLKISTSVNFSYSRAS